MRIGWIVRVAVAGLLLAGCSATGKATESDCELAESWWFEVNKRNRNIDFAEIPLLSADAWPRAQNEDLASILRDVTEAGSLGEIERARQFSLTSVSAVLSVNCPN